MLFSLLQMAPIYSTYMFFKSNSEDRKDWRIHMLSNLCAQYGFNSWRKEREKSDKVFVCLTISTQILITF